jgi:hypothetical protein
VRPAANDPGAPTPQSAIDLLSAAAEARPQPLPVAGPRERKPPDGQDPAHAPGKKRKKAPK